MAETDFVPKIESEFLRWYGNPVDAIPAFKDIYALSDVGLVQLQADSLRFPNPRATGKTIHPGARRYTALSTALTRTWTAPLSKL